MFFAKVKTPGLAHVAYLIGDGAEVAVVDPRRDVDAYLELARRNGLAIAWVIETHRQEDFVMGSAELARRTRAKIVCGDHERFGRGDVRLRDGEALALGGVTLRALHTPGHTPESTCYAVSIEDAPGRALGVFTGDTLFVGETGRVDLVGGSACAENAGLLFDSVREKILPLGDQAMIWPAHGAGSVCGGEIADRDETTLGVERAYNPVFVRKRQEFVDAKARERIPRPPYFSRMAEVNGDGGLPPGKPALSVPLLSPARFASAAKDAIVIDAREPEAFAGGHVAGSINVWKKGLAIFGGWVASAESCVLLVLGSIDELDDAVRELARIGIDGVAGVLAGGFEAWRDAGMPIACSATTDPRTVERAMDDTIVLDVRDESEWSRGHVAGALHAYVGHLDAEIERLRPALASRPNVVVTCSVGHRAGLAVSLLARRGVAAKNLLGGMTAWKKLGLPMTT